MDNHISLTKEGGEPQKKRGYFATKIQRIVQAQNNVWDTMGDVFSDLFGVGLFALAVSFFFHALKGWWFDLGDAWFWDKFLSSLFEGLFGLLLGGCAWTVLLSVLSFLFVLFTDKD